MECSRDHDHLSTGTMSDHEGGIRLIRGCENPVLEASGSSAPHWAAISAARRLLTQWLTGS